MEISYAKALNRIERFMESSGIRNICSNYCMGRCCEGCYKSEKACHKNEGRRLSCSFYMCYSLKRLVFTDHESKIFNTIDSAIGAKVREALKADKAKNGMYPNIYFEVSSRSVRARFSIDINILNKLDKIDIDNVQAKTFALCRLHRDFCLRAKIKDKKEG